MLAAGLLARNAIREGPQAEAVGQDHARPPDRRSSPTTTRSPGSTKSLEELGFYTVGYGCTICIGNSGPLIDEVSAAINENDLAVTAVLSGNRNFEGRISPDVKMNYLASPPLVIAYALAGSMHFDFETDALGTGPGRQRRVPARHLARRRPRCRRPSTSSISTEHVHQAVRDRVRRRRALEILPTPDDAIFEWDENSTYVRKPPYFDGMTMETHARSPTSTGRA